MAKKSVSIRIPEEVLERLEKRARVENTTVTALVTEAADRDPRMEYAAAHFKALLKDTDLVQQFAAAFPDEEPGVQSSTRAA